MGLPWSRGQWIVMSRQIRTQDTYVHLAWQTRSKSAAEAANEMGR